MHNYRNFLASEIMALECRLAVAESDLGKFYLSERTRNQVKNEIDGLRLLIDDLCGVFYERFGVSYIAHLDTLEKEHLAELEQRS